MTDDETHSTEIVEESSEGPDVDINSLLRKIVGKNTPVELLKFLKNYTYDIATTEIPTNEAEIKQLKKEQLRAIVQKLNLFSTFNMNAANPNQLECLRERTLECWGSPPKEDGAWVEWCLWHHYQRQTGGLSSINDQEVQSLRERASHYIRERERVRKEQLVESEQYDNVDDIPSSIRETIAGILQPTPQEDSPELPESER